MDEIQRLPSLLNEVHRFIEDERMQFVLLGSSARKLKQAGTNLLAGRALHRQMFPLLPQELGRDFNLAEVLRHGSLPVIWAAPDRREALESYVQMYLKEEIQAESLVRNLPGFARFLPVAAVFHGQVLSVAGLARDAGVARTTVDGYIGILAETSIRMPLRTFAMLARLQTFSLQGIDAVPVDVEVDVSTVGRSSRVQWPRSVDSVRAHTPCVWGAVTSITHQAR